LNNKIPADAFEYYVGLGPDRSHAAVADHYGVTKRAVTRRAVAEDWADRMEKIEAHAREKSDARLGDALAEMRERHLKTLKAMNMRAIQALQSYPLTSGMEAMRAAEMVIKLERLIHGEPTDRSAVSVEETIRHEYENWLKPARSVAGDGDDADD
jgi:hypothetical protein